jgi:hypothetical protein
MVTGAGRRNQPALDSGLSMRAETTGRGGIICKCVTFPVLTGHVWVPMVLMDRSYGTFRWSDRIDVCILVYVYVYIYICVTIYIYI